MADDSVDVELDPLDESGLLNILSEMGAIPAWRSLADEQRLQWWLWISEPGSAWARARSYETGNELLAGASTPPTTEEQDRRKWRVFLKALAEFAPVGIFVR